ncbi:MAG: hypothetical protein HQK53_17150 [Oligoflexia bacterium]|nr:hypothetical protein [Oligoflexia bacterium]
MACIHSEDKEKYAIWLSKTVAIGNCGIMLKELDEYDWQKNNRIDTLSTFISATAQTNDLEAVIEILQKTIPLFASSYKEYVDRIVNTINDLCFQLREKGSLGSIDRLKECSQKLIGIFEQDQYRSYHKEHLLRAIAITGAEDTISFISKHVERNEDQLGTELKQLIMDHTEIPSAYTSREQVTRLENEETAFLFEMPLEECVDKVIEIRNILRQKNLSLETNIRKIAELRIFNLFRKGDDIDIDTELLAVKNWVDRENKCKSNKYLPPIGGELEVPRTNKDEYKVMMSWFGIKTYDENGNLLEIQESPTYSAYLLNRLMQEVAMSGLIDLNEIKAEEPRFSTVQMSEQILSFHLNFGVPKNLCQKYSVYNETIPEFIKGKFKNELTNLMGMITFAFVSPERARKKKNNISWNIKSSNIEETEKNGNLRLELRTSEFRDFQTYRLTEESQYVVAAIFAKMEVDEGLAEGNLILSQLASLWEDAETQFIAIMNEAQVGDLDFLLNSNKHDLARTSLVTLLQNASLVNKTRDLFDTTAKYAKEIISSQEIR